MNRIVFASLLFAGVASFGGVIEYKGDFPKMETADFAALTNKVSSGDTLLILSEKTPKEFSWRTDAPERLLAWPVRLKLAKPQADRVSWRKMGRGLVVIAPESVDSPEFRTNLTWHADLLKDHGFWYVSYSAGEPLRPSLGVTMRYAEPVVEPKKQGGGGGYWANYDADRTRTLRPLYRLEGKISAGDGSYRNYETIEQPYGESLRIANVGMTKNVVHGRAKLETYFHDMDKGFSILIDSRELSLPEYLEPLLPNGGDIYVNRDEADVTVGFRINDEPHFCRDYVKVTMLDPSGKAAFATNVDAAVGQAIYVRLPVPREGKAGWNLPVRFETVRENGQIMKQERRLRIWNDSRNDVMDQDGMLLRKSSVRSFRFGENSSVTNFCGTKIVATWTFGESRAMTHVFAEQVRAARIKSGPFAPIAAQIAMDRCSRDREADRRAVRALAALAFIGGANAVDWDFSKCKSMLNPLASAAADAQYELLALDPAFAAKGRMVSSTDGALYARVTEKTILIVNTERFAAHESAIKVPAFADQVLCDSAGTSYRFDKNGILRLTLAPDAVLALRLQAL